MEFLWQASLRWSCLGEFSSDVVPYGLEPGAGLFDERDAGGLLLRAEW